MFERIKGLPASPGSLHEHIVERDDKAEKFFSFKFTVLGKGNFPYDMLRFDRCYPADSGSAGQIENRRTQELRHVCLITHDVRKNWLPEFERWKSFGWVVKSTAWERS